MIAETLTILSMVVALSVGGYSDQDPLWDEIIYSQPIWLDAEGKQKRMLHIVDKICGVTGCVNGLATAKEMWIVEGKFGNTASAKYFNNQGCTTFLHERYHMLFGDWQHQEMPYGCDGRWYTMQDVNYNIRDTDADGIIDRKDQCIDEPETWNKFYDEDGCPDWKQ